MLFLSFIVLCICGSLVTGANFGFTYPNATDPAEKNLVIEAGQVINIKWKAPFSAVKLAFVAEDGTLLQFFNENNTSDNLLWAVNVNGSGSSSPFYYLYLENENDSSQTYYSALFRVNNSTDTKATAAATTTVLPHPTSSATVTDPSQHSTTTHSASAFPMTVSSAASSSTTSSINVGSDYSGLSKSAKLGIGIGVPLAVLALIGLAVLAVWSSWRHSRAAEGVPKLPPFVQRPSSSVYRSYGPPSPTTTAGYGIRHSAYSAYDQRSPYDQHSEMLMNPAERGFAPVQEDQSHGFYEMPPSRVEALDDMPHELDGYAAAHMAGYLGDR